MSGSPALLVFETHPIQYRAPIFQRLQEIRPDSFEVVYASDFSVRGYADEGFGETIRWDQPLLSGYPHRVLHNDRDGGIRRFAGLSGRGVDALVSEVRPRAVMLSSLGYAFTYAAYAAALRRRIPVWYRADTNERAFARSRGKALLRAAYYRAAYLGIARALYVGALNRAHFERFGIGPARLTRVAHCTTDRVAGFSDDEKQARRGATRGAIGAAADDTVIAFFGKLIAKKDPALLIDAVAAMPSAEGAGLRLLFAGSGDLEAALRARAAAIPSHFAGFVNQGGLADYYLASDIVVLPSRRAGETWGLVVNEALQAGCAVVVSEEVGCAADFGGLERVRVIPAGDAAALARAIGDLRGYPRDFDWAAATVADYSVEAAAQSLAGLIDGLPERGR